MAVVLETSVGDITIDLYTEERPRCCLNFLKLCKMKYYNFCLFHSVQRSLVAQTGDPTGTGRGGESMFMKLYGEQARFFEMELKPRIKHKKKGTVSMVNNGDSMHASQFFITLGEDIDYLDGVHTVFGEVAEGFDILDAINEAYVDAEHRPYKDIRIYHTVVLDDPYDDPDGLTAHIPDRSPEPSKEQLESIRIGADEEIDDYKGLSKEEVEELDETRTAKANAQILEMVGDLPAADVEAPDNVLFVCKLNPVTTSEDLEIIFSRFGLIKSCEVIKDRKSGESLQYAFIEFEKPEDCESAYFKMDNVLIDDRRIHVDFSQSVSKIRWKGKGKGVEHSKEQERPSYVIKGSMKKDDGYELLFDEDELRGQDKRRSKKKKHRRSSSEDSDRVRKKQKKHSRQRSRSPSPTLSRKREHEQRLDRRDRNSVRSERDRWRNRDQDRPRNRSRERDRGRERDRRQEQGRSWDQNRSWDRNRSRERDRSRDRNRDRSRDRYCEKDRPLDRDKYKRDKYR